MFLRLKAQFGKSTKSALFFPSLIFLSALFVRLLYIFQTQKSPLGSYLVVDSKFYHAWALRISAGEWFTGDIFPMSPLYPYWLALLFTLFTKKLLFIKIIQVVLGSISCVLLFLFTENSTKERRAAVLAGFAAVLYGPFIFYDAMIMKTFFALFFTLLTAWVLSIPRETRLLAFLGGLCLALAALVRENIILLIPFLFVWLVFSSKEKKILKRGIRGVFFLLGVFLVIAPITTRNFVISGEFVLITPVGGENFYLGNNAGTDGYYRPPEFIAPNPIMEHENWRQRASKLLGHEVTAKESSDFWFSKGINFILGEPVLFAKLLVNKVVLFWNFYEAPDNYNFYFWQKLSSLLKNWTIHYGTVAPLTLLGLILSLKRRSDFMLPLMIFFIYFGSFLIFFNLSRYRLPVVPFSLLFAAYGANWVLKKMESGEFRSLFFAVPVLTLFFIVCNTPTRGVPHFGDDCDECFARLGSAYAVEKKFPEAEKAYKTAIKLNPGFAINRNGLGMIYLYQGKLHLAEQEFKAAIQIKPGLGEAHYNLATTYMSQNRLDEAIVGFKAALKHSFVPGFLVSMQNNLGNAYARKGLIAKAAEEFRKALKIDPSHKNAKRNLKILLDSQK
ncbi:MAG: tetratricopeptide repeat protein [Nitrospinota bacterium]